MTLKTFADAEARLAEALPNYEPRPEQQRLAAFVEDSIAKGEHALAEAGCGTGKSLGYLIPAILSGKRTVVSTATKALQDQLATKDLPFLAEHLGVSFDWALLKGRTNYLCLASLNDPDKAVPEREQIVEITRRTLFDGQRSNLDVSVDDQTWRELTVSSDECPGASRCPFGETCYAEKAKEAASRADVVVVNHALYLLDLRLRSQTDGWVNMLGDHEVVIFDEAHELEDWATSSFTDRLTAGGLKHAANELVHLVRALDLPGDAERVAENHQGSIASAVDLMWESLDGMLDVTDDDGRPSRLSQARVRVGDVVAREEEISAVIKGFLDAAEWLHRQPTAADASDIRLRARRARVNRRLDTTAASLMRLVTEGFDTSVRWVEVERTYRGDERLALFNAPIDVSTVLRPHLFDAGVVTTVLASATLSFDGDFTYVADRLGIDEYRSLDAGTPFDYESQAVLYVPADMSEPAGRTRNTWEAELPLRIEQLIRSSEGRALVLFTSIRDMNRVFDMLAPRLPWTCYRQGERPNPELMDLFASDESSVLFATKSFFTGVDVQGDSLGLVIVSKMPFPVPTDPIVEARTEAIDTKGGNSFSEFTMPYMGLALKQAFGRLIRHRNDHGVVAILDPRLESKGYGKRVVRSLPPARLVHTAEEAMSALEREEVVA